MNSELAKKSTGSTDLTNLTDLTDLTNSTVSTDPNYTKNDEKTEHHIGKNIILEEIDPNAKTVKAHLYKLNVSGSAFEAVHDNFHLIDEIFIPSLGVRVNFFDNDLNVVESEYRANDRLEHQELKHFYRVYDMEYYNHTEIEIPVDLYEKIKSIIDMKKQIEKTKKDLNGLQKFITGAPTTKTRYTNPKIKHIFDESTYDY